MRSQRLSSLSSLSGPTPLRAPPGSQTATTVGYGDVPNITQSGRLWACVHIMLSVCLLGELISTFDTLGTQRKETLARVAQLSRKLDRQLLDQLLARAKAMRPLVIRDGKGLTELEFVLAMCIELEVVKWDQVQPFIKQFRSLDVNGDARLGYEDLRLIEGKTQEEIRRMAQAIPEVPMSVEARMGVAFRRDSFTACSCTPATCGGSAESAAGAGLARPPAASAAEISLDGLSAEELRTLQARVEQKLRDAAERETSGGRQRVPHD